MKMKWMAKTKTTLMISLRILLVMKEDQEHDQQSLVAMLQQLLLVLLLLLIIPVQIVLVTKHGTTMGIDVDDEIDQDEDIKSLRGEITITTCFGIWYYIP